MTDETIVAVYDTDAHAEAAIADLIHAGVPKSDITSHAGTGTSGYATRTTAGAPAPEQGFWASLFGGEPDHDTAVYDRSVAGGGTVVTVKVPEALVTSVTEILESHNPIDLDERAGSYGLTATGSTGIGSTGIGSTGTGTTGTGTGTTGTGSIGTGTMGATERNVAPPAPLNAAATGASETISLAEESLSIGKRVVNRGGTRIRRFVVETPVEQNVSLRSEKVVLERRPVTDARPVSDGGFTEKTIEMVESAEEAVVSKTARVVEEVRLRKEATEHVETVRDTVRKQQVAVDQIPADRNAGQTDPRAPKI